MALSCPFCTRAFDPHSPFSPIGFNFLPLISTILSDMQKSEGKYFSVLCDACRNLFRHINDMTSRTSRRVNVKLPFLTAVPMHICEDEYGDYEWKEREEVEVVIKCRRLEIALQTEVGKRKTYDDVFHIVDERISGRWEAYVEGDRKERQDLNLPRAISVTLLDGLFNRKRHFLSIIFH